MSPTLRAGSRLAIDRLAYLMAAPKRGDVVVVRGGGRAKSRHLKRVVGLPGEEVAVGGGRLWINGAEFSEPYLADRPRTTGLEEGRWTVSEAEVFVLGDSRMASTDSRSYGPVATRRIEGMAWLCYWPVRALGRLPKR